VVTTRGAPQAGESVRRLSEAIREACVDAARAGYREAAISGLCHEGACEAAVGSIRRLDLDALAATASKRAEPRDAAASAAGAAAGTGALAATLVEGAAVLSAREGPEPFRKRARTIASRAAALRAALLAAGTRGAQPAPAADLDLDIDIAARGAQLANLAAELAREGPRAVRRDAAAAQRLATSAAECALALAEDDLHGLPESDSTRTAQRSIWRARLLLRRARPALEEAGR
jgi:hypothetical protein